MTTAILQDTAYTSGNQKYRPYASPNHHVTKGRYITSNDPRGYIPVYEYPLNGQWIMMDIDDGYILWTGIWKALGNSKADIVKMVDSQPELAPQIRRVRGGYLKIQGTWMPYDVALRLARRVAWSIRDDLIPLFGPTFPSSCLSPDQPGYGQVVASGPGRRRARRSTHPIAPSTWDATSRHPFPSGRLHPSSAMGPPIPTYGSPLSRPLPSSPTPRYTPYPAAPLGSNDLTRRRSSDSLQLDLPSLSLNSPTAFQREIVLPPVQPHTDRVGGFSRHGSNESKYALPPISALEDLRGVHSGTNSATAVLKRLQEEDDEDKSSDDSNSGRGRHFLALLTPSQPPPHLTGPPRSYPVSRPFSALDRLSVQSSTTDGGVSPSTSGNPSPISPTTPHSPIGGECARKTSSPDLPQLYRSNPSSVSSSPSLSSLRPW